MKKEEAYSILLRPHLTERSYKALAENKYTFLVAKDATKVAIKQAVETIFNVKVKKINTQWKRGKTRRTGLTMLRTRQGKTTSYKKAIITLKEGHSLGLFEA